VLQGEAPSRLRVLPVSAERLLTVREVAERLGVCTATVYGLCERGELPHVRVSNAIRIRPAAVEDFLLQGRR
jgi:excisionase family DNA binding protein